MDSNTHNKAVATFVLGIIAAVFAFFGWGAFIGLACGIVGIVLAKKAKEAGNTEGILQAGFSRQGQCGAWEAVQGIAAGICSTGYHA